MGMDGGTKSFAPKRTGRMSVCRFGTPMRSFQSRIPRNKQKSREGVLCSQQSKSSISTRRPGGIEEAGFTGRPSTMEEAEEEEPELAAPAAASAAPDPALRAMMSAGQT